MSKDRYRPSQADFEVVRTAGRAVADPGARFDQFQRERYEDDNNPDPTAGSLRVARQVVRYTDQGVMVVDVTLAWEPVSGVDEYRVRVAAA